MSISADMMRRLQVFQRKSAVYKSIFEADAQGFDNRLTAISDLKLQMSVDTATWALAIYEHELGLTTDLHKPTAERRAVIKSKMRGTGKVDAALIKLVADSYSNGDVEVTFDGTIKITFVSVFGVPSNLNDVMNAIEEIKPAHLPVNFTFRYYLYADLIATEKTYDQMTGITYDELYNGGVA